MELFSKVIGTELDHFNCYFSEAFQSDSTKHLDRKISLIELLKNCRYGPGTSIPLWYFQELKIARFTRFSLQFYKIRPGCQG